MKKLPFLSTLIASALCSFIAHAQTADVQVIHNAADPAAATVDVYIDGTLTLDDFTFRSATPFVTLPSGVPLDVGIAPSTSTSVADTIKNFTLTLADGGRYVAMANGLVGPGFAANPDGRSTAFDLFIIDSIAETTAMGQVDFIAFHGATDAPAVDVIARQVATLVDDASYGDATPYISVPAGSYILDVTPSAGSPIVATFEADLSGLGGGTAIVFASGFLDSTMNQNGPAFGLFAALSDGTVLTLPALSAARLQVIHNAADPAAATVDVYVNDALLLDDFAFRAATPYIDVPAGVMLNIGVAPGNSASAADTLKNFEVMLMNGNTYIAVANGVLNPASFAVNPDAQPTAFTLFLQDMMRESATDPMMTDLRIVHGSSDAPTVDILTGATNLADDVMYGDISAYLQVMPAVYTLDITPGNDNSTIVASFTADLSSLTGASAVVLASGFLDPSMNQNGAAFALIAVLADGTVIPLSNTTSVQTIDGAGISLYPNPATSNFQVTLTNDAIGSSLLIRDAMGRTVRQYEFEKSISLDVSEWTEGFYLVELISGNSRITNKLIVNRSN